jgi:hypothetical protein
VKFGGVMIPTDNQEPIESLLIKNYMDEVIEATIFRLYMELINMSFPERGAKNSTRPSSII